ncbi:MAG: hypothetical protein Q7S56_00720 [Nanoarchaeota archaeon]|nr:hypothetical protein [Nanoarchaeota archaeon]
MVKGDNMVLENLDLNAFKGKTYSRDNRTPIEKLYRSYLKLADSPKWIVEEIDFHVAEKKGKKLLFPVFSFRTKKRGKAVWIISGIHGEEPAGPITIAKNIYLFEKLAKEGIPVVLIPLANPTGYFRNWRYLSHPHSWIIGKSIGDSGHLLLTDNKPRRKKPRSFEADIFATYVFDLTREYPPLFVLDFHEDNIKTIGQDTYYKYYKGDPARTYIYSQGKFGSKDLIAREIIEIMRAYGHPLSMTGYAETRFKEKIVNGIVAGVKDSSIDELLAANRIFLDGKIVRGPSASSVIVIETLTNDFPLKHRVKIHEDILHSIKRFIQLSKKQVAK